jgi:hypothetical protein
MTLRNARCNDEDLYVTYYSKDIFIHKIINRFQVQILMLCPSAQNESPAKFELLMVGNITRFNPAKNATNPHYVHTKHMYMCHSVTFSNYFLAKNVTTREMEYMCLKVHITYLYVVLSLGYLGMHIHFGRQHHWAGELVLIWKSVNWNSVTYLTEKSRFYYKDYGECYTGE